MALVKCGRTKWITLCVCVHYTRQTTHSESVMHVLDRSSFNSSIRATNRLQTLQNNLNRSVSQCVHSAARRSAEQPNLQFTADGNRPDLNGGRHAAATITTSSALCDQVSRFVRNATNKLTSFRSLDQRLERLNF